MALNLRAVSASVTALLVTPVVDLGDSMSRLRDRREEDEEVEGVLVLEESASLEILPALNFRSLLDSGEYLELNDPVVILPLTPVPMPGGCLPGIFSAISDDSERPMSVRLVSE